MTVPYTFGTATTSIPLSNLDANFNTPITLGNTSIYLGNTTTTIGNLTLTNATISSGTVNITNVTVTTANVTNITVSGTTTLSGLTASTALALDASKNVISVTNTGTGNNVLSANPTLTGTIAGASLSLSSLTSGRVTYAGTAGLLQDSASFVFDGSNVGLGVAAGGTTRLSVTASSGSLATFQQTGATGYGVTIVPGADTTYDAFTINNAANSANKIRMFGNGNATFAGTLTTSLDASINGLTVGRGAGSDVTNNAFGFNALSGSNTGSNNTAIGWEALKVNTSGGQNIALGRSALIANQTGSGNIAVGVGALSVNVSGSNNTAVGSDALVSSTASSNNVAIGYQAGYKNTGDVNVYVGRIAGYNNTGAGANTFVGQNAGNAFNVASGNTFNSFFGCDSGQAITSGINNTIIGSYSGNQGGLDIRTASNYIVLSDGAGNIQQSSYNGGTTALQGAVPNVGTGITFPATQSASANANTLDDYEEGTFTPTISGSTSAGTGTYTTQSGSYTKIGRQVSFRLQVFWSAHTGTGGLLVTSLPFTCSGIGGATIGLLNDLTLTALNYAMADIVDGTTSVRFRQYPVGGTGITDVAMSNASNIVLSGTYFV